MVRAQRDENVKVRVQREERGERARFEDIEVGRKLGPHEWIVTVGDIDKCCLAFGEFHEWYSVDSPFGGRIAPISISYLPLRAIFTKAYLVQGLFVGWSTETYDVIRPNRKMLLQGQVVDKYVKRNREWVWYEFVCRDAETGRDILKTKRGHILDFIPIGAPKEAAYTGPLAGEEGRAVEVVKGYTPPWPVTTRESVERVPGALISRVRVAGRETPLGTELVPVSCQMTWRFARDYYEQGYNEVMAEVFPPDFNAHNIHTDDESAKREGLAGANAAGPHATVQIFKMMHNAFGEGWVQGGGFNLRVIKQIMLDDFMTAKGVVIGHRLEGGRVRVECNVWTENQRGEKLAVGTASALC
ncbi:MAG: hypothetical protein HY525_02990 [Betaproteobacteria bacterium]|nr:hypothetical protein [Betaproteobacteria bacterium]